MLKKLLWNLLATATGMNFKNEYERISKLGNQIFLKNLLIHAYNNVPYYHSILGKAAVVKNGKTHLRNFENIPILTKEILRKRASDLVSRDYGRRKWFYNVSSGSTGEPVRFVQDRAFTKWILVTSRYYYEIILGLKEFFARKMLLWASPIEKFGLSFGLRASKLNDTLTNTRYLNPLYMTEADMEKYARSISSYKPSIIRGYASALYEFSRFIEKRKIPIHTPNMVISSAEMLHDYRREKIEAAFGTKVYDFYGTREADGISGECKNGLSHLFMFNNYVEVVDSSNNKVKEGENGRVIVTTLHNYSMPLIRYDIGDMAILGPEKCKCGNPLPTLKKITGRSSSFFRKEDGTIIGSFYFGRIFLLTDNVKEFRIIQEDYKRIRIRIAFRDKTIEESEKRDIEEKIRLAMGEDCKVIWEVVDKIPKTSTGKRIIVQSLLSE